MLRRTYLGLDIAGNELRAVALRRAGRGSSLTGGKFLPLAPGRLAVSPHKLNILDQSGLISDLKDLFDGLAGREERVSVSLPDLAGRLLLTEVETPFKNRAEGQEILRWQMKKKLPVELGALHLDFQTLQRDDSGRTRVLVGLLSKAVVEQYEDVLGEAGFQAVQVELHALGLFNYYQPRLDLGDDFLFIGVENDNLIIKYFQEKVLTFCRVKRLIAHPEKVFQEVNRSIVGLREQFSSLRRSTVFAHVEPTDTDAYVAGLRTVFEREITLLDPKIDRLTPAGTHFDRAQATRLTAAIGTAERLM
jgi:type IV pilus assembly protein PilM